MKISLDKRWHETYWPQNIFRLPNIYEALLLISILLIDAWFLCFPYISIIAIGYLIKDYKHRVFFLILASLFIAQLYIFELCAQEKAIISSDSFRYLWKIDVNQYFFFNSAFFVRFSYWVFDYDLEKIVTLQKIVSFAPLILMSIVVLTDQTMSRLRTFIYIIFLLLIFSSTSAKFYVSGAQPESLTVNFMIIYCTMLILANSRLMKFATIIIGLTFILTRNTSPYAAIIISILFAIINTRKENYSFVVIICITTILFSIISMKVVQSVDKQVGISASQVYYDKVFPFTERVDHFHNKYGMPVGPFIEACKLGDINNSCFDNRKNYTSNQFSRTYRVRPDNYGFAEWVGKYGFSAWKQYIIFDNPLQTAKWAQNQFREVFMFHYTSENKEMLKDINLLTTIFMQKLKLDNIFIAIAFLSIFTIINRFFLFSNIANIGILLSISAMVIIVLTGLGDANNSHWLRHSWVGTQPYLTGLYLIFIVITVETGFWICNKVVSIKNYRKINNDSDNQTESELLRG